MGGAELERTRGGGSGCCAGVAGVGDGAAVGVPHDVSLLRMPWRRDMSGKREQAATHAHTHTHAHTRTHAHTAHTRVITTQCRTPSVQAERQWTF